MKHIFKLSAFVIIFAFSINLIPVAAYSIGEGVRVEIPSKPGGNYGGGYDHGGKNPPSGGGSENDSGSSGGGSKNTGNKETSPGGSTSKPGSQGTEKNPYIQYKKLSSTYSLASVKKELEKAMDNTSDNGEKKYTWKTPGSSVVLSSSTKWMPDHITNPPIPFFMKTYYSSIWIQSKSTVTEKSTFKDKYYKWTVSGAESYSIDSSKNTFSLTFKKTGVYRVSVVPYEEKTKTVSGTIKSTAYDIWPSESGKKATAIASSSRTIPKTTTTSVSGNNARRMEWEFYVTASDINKVISIGPTPPPGTTPPGGVGNPNISDEDADVTIID